SLPSRPFFHIVLLFLLNGIFPLLDLVDLSLVQMRGWARMNSLHSPASLSKFEQRGASPDFYLFLAITHLKKIHLIDLNINATRAECWRRTEYKGSVQGARFLSKGTQAFYYFLCATLGLIVVMI